MNGCKRDVYTKDRRRKLNKFFIVSCSRLTLRLLFSYIKAQYTSCTLFVNKDTKICGLRKQKTVKIMLLIFHICTYTRIHWRTLLTYTKFLPESKGYLCYYRQKQKIFIQDWNLDVNETPYYSPTVFSSTWLRQVKSRQ